MYENYEHQNGYETVHEGTTGETIQAPPVPPVKTPKTKNPIKKALALVFSGILFGTVAGLMIVAVLVVFKDQIKNLSASDQATQTIQTIHTISTNAIAKEDQTSMNNSQDQVMDVSSVVDKVMPSVVSITGIYKTQSDFFGFTDEYESSGSGSGIIIGENQEELLIVTNAHVVKDASSLSVQFIDGESYDAKVKGKHGKEDLAVIAVSLANIKDTTKGEIKIAVLGDSDSLKVGEPAIAIGNALGYGQSVTTGVISASNREMTQDNYTTYLIQTDAAINPGNSGGALLNIQGEVIGINSNKIASDAVEGMGYAIPISSAKPIIEELMKKETRDRVNDSEKAYLGIAGVSVTPEVQEQYGMPEGVYVAQVKENTSAQRAGLVKGDIIVEFDGEKIATFEDLSELLGYYESGTTIQIKVMQGSPEGYKEKEIEVVLGSISSAATDS